MILVIYNLRRLNKSFINFQGNRLSKVKEEDSREIGKLKSVVCK